MRCDHGRDAAVLQAGAGGCRLHVETGRNGFQQERGHGQHVESDAGRKGPDELPASHDDDIDVDDDDHSHDDLDVDEQHYDAEDQHYDADDQHDNTNHDDDVHHYHHSNNDHDATGNPQRNGALVPLDERLQHSDCRESSDQLRQQ